MNLKKLAKKLLFGLTFAQILIPTSLAVKAEDNHYDFKKIDSYITSEMKGTHIPGLSAGIIKDDKIVFLKGYGKADSTGRSVTSKTPFVIGSVSKSFTALSVMQLAEGGFIELDASIKNYLPCLKNRNDNFSKITVRQLLNHTSGIPAYFDNTVNTEISIEQLVESRLVKTKLITSPGTSFKYSNANYIILGEIIQKVSKQSYEEYITEHIFKPLEMNNSYVSLESGIKGNMASGYKPFYGIPFETKTKFFRSSLPAGYIISTAEDMCHYISIFMNNGKYNNTSILSPHGIEEMVKPAVKTPLPLGIDADECYYGMGLDVLLKDGVVDSIGHSGEIATFHADVMIKPKEKIGIVILDNLGGSFTAGQIVPGISDILSGKTPPKSFATPANMMMVTNVILIIITALIITSALRLKKWKSNLHKRKALFILKMLLLVIVNFIIPIALLVFYPSSQGANWRCMLFYSTDVSIACILISIALLAIGFIKSKYVYFTLKN